MQFMIYRAKVYILISLNSKDKSEVLFKTSNLLIKILKINKIIKKLSIKSANKCIQWVRSGIFLEANELNLHSMDQIK
jgi:hypothetical protein